MIGYISGFVLVVLAVRHLPQLCLDIARWRRTKTAQLQTRARSSYIIGLYVLILGFWFHWMYSGGLHDLLSATLGGILVLAGSLIGIISLAQLGSAYSIDISVHDGFRLVTNGIYGIVRHPFRMGLSLEALGLIVMCKMPFLLMPWCMILWVQRIRTREEDAFLREHLGDECKRYQDRVPAYDVVKGFTRRHRDAERRLGELGIAKGVAATIDLPNDSQHVVGCVLPQLEMEFLSRVG